MNNLLRDYKKETGGTETPAFSDEKIGKIMGNLGIESGTNILNYFKTWDLGKEVGRIWEKVANGEGITAEEYFNLANSINLKDTSNKGLYKKVLSEGDRKKLIKGLQSYINNLKERRKVFYSSLGIKDEKKANDIAKGMNFKNFLDFYWRANGNQLVEFSNKYSKTLKGEANGKRFIMQFMKYATKLKLKEGNKNEAKDLIEEGRKRFGEEFVNKMLNDIANDFIKEKNTKALGTLMEVGAEMGIKLKIIELQENTMKMMQEYIKKMEELKKEESNEKEEAYKQLTKYYEEVGNYLQVMEVLEEEKKKSVGETYKGLDDYIRDEMKKMEKLIANKYMPANFGGSIDKPPSYNKAKENWNYLIKGFDEFRMN